MRHQLDEQEWGEGKAGKKADAVNSPYCFSPTLDSFPVSRKGQGWLVAAARMNGSALRVCRGLTLPEPLLSHLILIIVVCGRSLLPYLRKVKLRLRKVKQVAQDHSKQQKQEIKTQPLLV